MKESRRTISYALAAKKPAKKAAPRKAKKAAKKKAKKAAGGYEPGRGRRGGGVYVKETLPDLD